MVTARISGSRPPAHTLRGEWGGAREVMSRETPVSVPRCPPSPELQLELGRLGNLRRVWGSPGPWTELSLRQRL